MAADASGNVYVEEADNQIREISPAGVVTTVTSNSSGPIALDGRGNLYAADRTNIDKISLTGYTISPALPPGLAFDGTIGTISGTPLLGTAAANYTVTAHNITGTGTASISIAVTGALTATPPTTKAPVITIASPQTYAVGTAITALNVVNTGGAIPAAIYAQTTTLAMGLGTGNNSDNGSPNGVATDASGNVYLADDIGNVIRKITAAGVSSIFAGSGSAGSANGTGTAASFNSPQGMGI